jgi:DNA-binding MurR/RpiR family transcriptional regulator
MTASPLPLSALVDKHRFELSPAERSAAAFFVEHGDRLGFWSAIEIARALGVSDATVVRTAQTLGYSGFNELKRSLRAGAGDATLAERMRATIPSGGGASDALVGVLRDHRSVGAARELRRGTPVTDRHPRARPVAQR